MKLHAIWLLLLTAFVGGVRADYRAEIALDRESGLYEAGETAIFTVSFADGGKIPPGGSLRYVLKFGGKQQQTGTFEVDGKPKSFEFTVDRPGWAYFGLEALGGDGKPRTDLFKHHAKKTIINEIGAIFSPEKITAKPSRPADFDAYWTSLRSKLDEVPIRAQLTPVELPEAYRGKVECFAVSVDCYGAHPVTGYLALPRGAKPQSLVAEVNFLSLSWRDADRDAALRSAAAGALVFAVSWHGAPAGLTEKDYREHPVIGQPAYSRAAFDSRDGWFFRDMYIRAMRALDYVKSCPEWNGRDLAVQGGSLGGAQAIAAAALDPAVTLAVVSVPSQCEFNALESGRLSGLPFNRPQLMKRWSDDPGVGRAAAYYDMVNFAPAIRCEIILATGLTDETCYPDNVYAFYNAIPASAKKTITVNPRTGHFGTTANVRGSARLKALFQGTTVHE